MCSKRSCMSWTKWPVSFLIYIWQFTVNVPDRSVLSYFVADLTAKNKRSQPSSSIQKRFARRACMYILDFSFIVALSLALISWARLFWIHRYLQLKLNVYFVNCSFVSLKQANIIPYLSCREEDTSSLAGFHAGSLSWSNWNLKCWVLWREKNRRTQARRESTTNSTHIWHRARIEPRPHWCEASAHPFRASIPSLIIFICRIPFLSFLFYISYRRMWPATEL